MKLLPVILAGGIGSRLWPLSRQLNPKQFLALFGEKTLFQETIGRLQGLDHDVPWVICNEQHRFLAAEQLRQSGIASTHIFLEPEGRNTAPAIAVAALQAVALHGDGMLLVLAADHVIQDVAAFHQAIEKAASLAQDGLLVTFGVTPSGPETGYGYIQCGKSLGELGYEVERFAEKPAQEDAMQYLASGDYLWNSGMFLFRASRYLEELNRFQPEIVAAAQDALHTSQRDFDFIRLDVARFLACPSNSIDYAVMEKTSASAVVPLHAGWSDVGSWSALCDVKEQDEAGNVLHGDAVVEQVKNSMVHAEHRLVAAVGVENLVIVETKDAVLVVDKSRVQEVKNVVERIKADGRHEHMVHREVYRPWGMYDSIDQGLRYQVKRITVKPGAKLSVQMHYHRAEHWIVVRGTAKVTRGEDSFVLTENQSTFIPVGERHALENPGKMPLELIEVQSGAYLGEDDIVRLEDRYGRL